MAVPLWELYRGEGPVVINVPHAGTYLPEPIFGRLSLAASMLPDTDWHVEKLYHFAHERGATLMCATHSRYVIDLNRDPSGAVLYAGADNTELCPTRTFANEPIYAADDPITRADVEARIAAYFDPYHTQLAAELERIRARYGYVVLLDGHSIRSEVPRFFAGRLPDLNLGTAGGASCPPALEALAAAELAAEPKLSHVVNGRFKGGWITRHYGRPADGVYALQLEIGQGCYMEESPPYPWDPLRAALLSSVLRRLVTRLLGWRP